MGELIKVSHSTESLDDPTNASLLWSQRQHMFLLKNTITITLEEERAFTFLKMVSNLKTRFWQKYFSTKPVTTLTFLSKLPKLPVLIRDDRFWFPRFPQRISAPLGLERGRICGSFFIWVRIMVFEDLGNCLWGLKPPHPLCSPASPLQSQSTVLL